MLNLQCQFDVCSPSLGRTKCMDPRGRLFPKIELYNGKKLIIDIILLCVAEGNVTGEPESMSAQDQRDAGQAIDVFEIPLVRYHRCL